MKYWKNGFYDEPVDGSVEITDEHYNQLLDGQSNGLLIVESKNGYPILVEYEYDIEEVRKMKISNKMQKILDIFECKIYITYCKVIDGIALLLQAIKVNDERWMR